MAISLSKGGNINLSKTVPTMKKVDLGLGWNPHVTGQAFDLDAMAFLVNENGKLRSESDFIFFNQKTSVCGSVIHNGDNRTGDGNGDDETISVDLSKVPADVNKIIFSVTIHEGEKNGQNFGQIDRAYIRVMNQDANGEEIARFDLSEDGGSEVVMIFGELYRHNGEWKFKAVGQGFNGGLNALIRHFGAEVAEDTTTPPAEPKQSKLDLKKKVILDKIEQAAPHLLDLTKKSLLSLEKRNLLDIKARVALVLDYSGSMSQQYKSGDVQRILDRIMPLALNFDDDGQFECWAFAQNSVHLSDIHLNNLNGYIENEKGGYKNWQAGARYNNEPAVLEQVVDYFTKQHPSTIPVYVVFISDGGITETGKIKKILKDASSQPIFWQFVGVGGKNYGILEKLDTMSGRMVDNCNFFAIDHIQSIPDSQLYDYLLQEFPLWLTEAKNKNILR